MGGSGSGRRWHIGAKSTADEYRFLDVRLLKREGVLVPGSSLLWGWDRGSRFENSVRINMFENEITLDYRTRRSIDDDWQSYHQLVELNWTQCHLGGFRPWFICPGIRCGKRVAILYAGKEFLCRRCLGIVYGSQREGWSDRLARKVNKIRFKLGWKQGVLNAPVRRKPKSMHWNTFESISARHDQLLNQSLRAILSSLPHVNEDEFD